MSIKKSVHTSGFKLIRKKIDRLHTAIMYSMSNELIEIPACVVTLLGMDEEGHMWFESKEPVVYIQEYEHSFPARLHFYRKGFNYYVDVNGSAVIMNVNESGSNQRNEPVLLKLNVNNIEYVEPQARRRTWLDQLIERSYNWIWNRIVLPGNFKTFPTKPHNR